MATVNIVLLVRIAHSYDNSDGSIDRECDSSNEAEIIPIKIFNYIFVYLATS